ncbi:MAG: hypothetical protein J6C52_13600 [Clostridia bacterium]|nr:hypothetical protein [Clostridia bacterium]
MYRIGVINWDCSLPPETYFGYHQTKSLSPKKFRTVTPYYADILGEDKISYHYRTQEEIDRELQYAIDAGIDYFAYVWYPDEGSRTHVQETYNDCAHRVYELNYARKMHQSSALRHKLPLCAIVGLKPFADSDLRDLALTMQEPYYECIDGRPLTYFFGGERIDVIERLRSICREVGTPDPFCVAMFSGGGISDSAFTHVEALSAYSCPGSGIDTCRELIDYCLDRNEKRYAAGKPVIPQYTTGWDPSPRLDSPAPWCSYPGTNYAKFASDEELFEGAQALVEWMNSKPAGSFVGHIITFAWNEFEEGGMICPTFNADGVTINTSRIAAFKRIADYFRAHAK